MQVEEAPEADVDEVEVAFLRQPAGERAYEGDVLVGRRERADREVERGRREGREVG